MDIQRPDLVRKRRVRRGLVVAVALLLLTGVAVWAVRLEPRAPAVQKDSVWVEKVERGQLDVTVLLWGLALIFTTVLIVGLSPARLLWRLDYQTVLQEGACGSTGGGARLRSALGVVQAGLAVLLLVATGLFVRSFWHATVVSPGFDANGVSTFRISMPEAIYPGADARVATVRRVLEQLRAIPGVEHVAGATSVPVVTGAANNALWVRGEELSNDQLQKLPDTFSITEGFFETLGISLLDGRGIEESDTSERNGVFVVDRTFGQRFLPEGAVGGPESRATRRRTVQSWTDPARGMTRRSSGSEIWILECSLLTIFLSTVLPARGSLRPERSLAAKERKEHKEFFAVSCVPLRLPNLTHLQRLFVFQNSGLSGDNPH